MVRLIPISINANDYRPFYPEPANLAMSLLNTRFISFLRTVNILKRIYFRRSGANQFWGAELAMSVYQLAATYA